LIALDQLDQAGLQAETVVPLLTSSEPVLRETAGWIVDRHPEWGPNLVDHFAAQLASAQLSLDERRGLQNRLSIFAETDAVQTFLADCLNDAKVPDDAKSLVLAAMAETRLSEPPPRWIAALSDLLAGAGPGLQRDAIAALRQFSTEKLADDALATRLIDIGRDKTNSAELRLQAMAAVPGGLDAVDDGLLLLTCQHLDPDVPVSLRAAAIEVLEKAELSPSQLIELAGHLTTVSPLDVDGLLAVFERTSDERVGLAVVAALNESPTRSALRVEMLQPRLAHFPDAVQQEAERLFELVRQDNAGQHQRLEELLASLPTGDIRRGQRIFQSSQAACSACHAIGYLGGNTGPDLTHIGRIRSPRDLLESVVFPSASLVRSFESVTVVTVDGRLHNGLVFADSERELVLTTGPNQEVRIPRDDIEAIQQSDVSIMPAGLDKQLSRQELADLVEFLKAAQ
jgi:putative heme-binding domain-containing protein